MARIRNDSGTDLILFGPIGHPDAYHVADGQIIDLPGDIVEGKGLEGEDANGIPTDAFQIGEGDAARLFSTSMWTVTKATERSGSRSGSRSNDEDGE